MKKIFVLTICVATFFASYSQTDIEIADPKLRKEKEGITKEKLEEDRKKDTNFTIIKSLPATSVKSQGITGTCWCFSTTSLIESQCIKNNVGEIDLSEMFTVRNTYIEKAKNYLLRQGHAQFGEGGMGHDLINAIAKYGAMPEEVYSGIKPGKGSQHNHSTLVKKLKNYLDTLLNITPIKPNWEEEFEEMIDEELGDPPAKFSYKGKEYTPKSFATDVLKFNAADYIYVTSFTHHPYYTSFAVEVPDNFSSGLYYNIPVEDMLAITKDAVSNGYSVMWDADVSNDGFQQKMGAAVNFNNFAPELKRKGDLIDGKAKEGNWDVDTRQKLFENLTTQDDHLMHITGLAKSKTGNNFFLVKNSWGDIGPRHGYIYVSEPYFAINTVTLVIPKAALTKQMLEKIKMK